MLYENQVHGLLEHCEELVGRTLDQLRSNLAAKHKHGALWELVTLYVTSKVAKIDHEPREAVPDVLVSPDNSGSFWIEAKHAGSPISKELDRLAAFCRWISEELKKKQINASNYTWRIDEISRTKKHGLVGDPFLGRRDRWNPITTWLRRCLHKWASKEGRESAEQEGKGQGWACAGKHARMEGAYSH